MSETTTSPLAQHIGARLGDKIIAVHEWRGETLIDVLPENWLAVAAILRDQPEFRFEQLIDLCGVDFLGYGQDEWNTEDVSSNGFSRGVEGLGPGRFRWLDRPRPGHVERRFAVVAQLLSLANNQRVRLRAFCHDDSLPLMPSLVGIWPGVNWFEREAFDLYGIVFEGHPDLRRLLTDYGFVGHPFRKDFPLIGNVEVRYDPEKGRVVYEPVSIEPRVLVPRVIRHDARYATAREEAAGRGEAEK